MELKDKNVIVKMDFDIKLIGGKPTNDEGIDKIVETIKKLQEIRAKAIVLGTYGKVETKSDEVNNTFVFLGMEIKKRLGQLGFDFQFVNGVRGHIVDYATSTLGAGRGGKVLLLQNTAFEKDAEITCDPKLAKYFASKGEIFLDLTKDVTQKSFASNKGIRENIATVIEEF